MLNMTTRIFKKKDCEFAATQVEDDDETQVEISVGVCIGCGEHAVIEMDLFDKRSKEEIGGVSFTLNEACIDQMVAALERCKAKMAGRKDN